MKRCAMRRVAVLGAFVALGVSLVGCVYAGAIGYPVYRYLSTPARRDERAALDKAYEAQFGDSLYIALTKRFKDPIQWQRIGALWDLDTAKDDRLATQAHVDKIKKAEAAAPKLNPWVKPQMLMGKAKKDYEAGQRRIRDARAALETHYDEMAAVMALSAATVDTELRFAKAWLRQQLDAAG